MITKKLRKCKVSHWVGIGRNSRLKYCIGYFHKWIERKNEDGNFYTVGLIEDTTTGELNTFHISDIEFINH